RWARRSPTSTATAGSDCRQTFCKHSGITSGPTPTNASTGRAASSFTPTGPAAAAPPRRRLITYDSTAHALQHVGFRDLRSFQMHEPSYAFLKQLLETPSPSGGERAIQDVVRDWARRYTDDVRTDRHGNVIAVARPKKARGEAPRVMLAGHCD